MRKTIVIFMILTALLLPLTSCLPGTPDPPHGVWMSEEPRIILHFKPEYQLSGRRMRYVGFYTQDGVDIQVLTRFGNGPRFEVYCLAEGLSERGGFRGEGLLLSGSNYRIVNDEIRFTASDASVERLGLTSRNIIFRRIEDYAPINPDDWYPHTFPGLEGIIP